MDQMNDAANANEAPADNEVSADNRGKLEQICTAFFRATCWGWVEVLDRWLPEFTTCCCCLDIWWGVLGCMLFVVPLGIYYSYAGTRFFTPEGQAARCVKMQAAQKFWGGNTTPCPDVTLYIVHGLFVCLLFGVTNSALGLWLTKCMFKGDTIGLVEVINYATVAFIMEQLYNTALLILYSEMFPMMQTVVLFTFNFLAFFFVGSVVINFLRALRNGGHEQYGFQALDDDYDGTNQA